MSKIYNRDIDPATYNFSDKKVLNFLEEYCNIDLEQINLLMHEQMNKKYLEMHKNKITQLKNGTWFTRVKDSTTASGYRSIKKQSRDDLIKELIDFYKAKEDNPSLEEIFESREKRRVELKEISWSSYDRHHDTFNRHFSEFGKKKIKTLSTKEVIDFLRKENAEKELNRKAFMSLKEVISGIIDEAEENEYIDEEDYIKYVTRLKKLKVKHKQVVKKDADEVFSEIETKILYSYLVDNISNIRNLGLLLMMVTGMRVGELAALKFEDFTLNTVSIRRTESKRKTDRRNSRGQYITDYFVKDFPKTKDSVRTIVLPTSALFIIQAIINRQGNDRSAYVFTNEDGSRMNTCIFDSRLRTACKSCGIKPKSCHKIRKTYISILLDEHLDNNLIRQQVGHVDIRTSEENYHRNRKDEKRKQDILSAIKEFQILSNG